MAFAIFYERVDLEAMAEQLSRQDLAAGDLAEAEQAWDHGFRHWDTAGLVPMARFAAQPNSRLLVISSNSLNLEDFRALLRRIAAQFPGDLHAEYMDSIANDLGGSDAAEEPWNAGG